MNPKHSTKWHVDYLGWHGTEEKPMGEGWLTVKDHAILTALDDETSSSWRGIHLTQGGLSTAVADSANTHTGLGAFDIRTRNNTKKEVWDLSEHLLRSGLVPFPRGYNSGYDYFRSNKHCHVVSRESYASLHPEAKAQYHEYDGGGDGLYGSARYTGPATKLERWSASPYNPINQRAEHGVYYVTVDDGFLWGLNLDRKKMMTHETGDAIAIDRQVKRFGRWNGWTSNDILYSMDYLSKEQPQ